MRPGGGGEAQADPKVGAQGGSQTGLHLPHVHLPHVHLPHVQLPHIGHQKKAEAPVVTERTAVARQWSAETVKRAVEAGFAPPSHSGFHLPHVHAPHLHLPHVHAPHLHVPHIGHQKKAEVGGSASRQPAQAAGQSHLPHIHMPHIHMPHLHAPHLHVPHFGHHKKKDESPPEAQETVPQESDQTVAGGVSASAISAALAEADRALSC